MARTPRNVGQRPLIVAAVVLAGGVVAGFVVGAPGCQSDATPPAESPSGTGPATTTSAAGTGGGPSGAVTVYKPEGCAYEVRVPEGTTGALDDGVVGRGAAVDHVHVSFAGPTDTSFAVNWRSGLGTTASQLLYGTDKTAVASAQAASGGVKLQRGHTIRYASLLDGTTETRVHEVHVCGLAPSTRYHYKVGGPGAWSEVFETATGPAVGAPEPIRIGVLGDSRNDPTAFARIMEKLVAEGTDLVLFTGDAVVTGLAQIQWDELFEAQGAEPGGAQRALASLPMMMANGNHDALAVGYLAQFALPQELSPGESSEGEEWYSLDYGNVHVAVLNDTTASQRILTGPERAWLESDLAKVDRQKTPWVFAVHHRPLYSCSNHGSDKKLRQAWQPLYDKYTVDLVLNGHDHNYERSLPVRGFEADGVEGKLAAQGTVYVVSGGAGAPLYGSKKCPHTFLSESVRHYVVVEIADKTLKLRAHRLDGSLLDSFELAK
jgi:hypothetical protein